MKNRISGYVSYDAYCVSIKWKVAYRSRSFFSHLLVISRFDNSYHQTYLLLRNITSFIQILYPKNDSIYKKKKKKKKEIRANSIRTPKRSPNFTCIYTSFRYHDTPATNISKLHDRYTSHRYTVPTQKTF